MTLIADAEKTLATNILQYEEATRNLKQVVRNLKTAQKEAAASMKYLSKELRSAAPDKYKKVVFNSVWAKNCLEK